MQDPLEGHGPGDPDARLDEALLRGAGPWDTAETREEHERILERIDEAAARPELVARGRIYRMDARVGDLVRYLTRRGRPVDLWVRATTDLGSLFVVAPAAAGLWTLGRRRLGVEIAAAGVLGWMVSQTAKRSFDRGRPFEVEGVERLIPPPSGSSLPSGHAAVAAAVATVLAADSRPGRRWPWGVLAAYVPVTRVHLGVHYPGDTAVGAAMGWALGRAVRGISRRVGPGSPDQSPM